MRQALYAASDRMLERFLPRLRAGACPCSPADSYYEYRCRQGRVKQRRIVRFDCNCVVSYGAWTDTAQDC